MAETPIKPGQRPGLICPRCGHDRWRVIYTRARVGGQLLRRRECTACKARITTREKRL